jgi:hypothetical protein
VRAPLHKATYRLDRPIKRTNKYYALIDYVDQQRVILLHARADRNVSKNIDFPGQGSNITLQRASEVRSRALDSLVVPLDRVQKVEDLQAVAGHRRATRMVAGTGMVAVSVVSIAVGLSMKNTDLPGPVGDQFRAADNQSRNLLLVSGACYFIVGVAMLGQKSREEREAETWSSTLASSHVRLLLPCPSSVQGAIPRRPDGVALALRWRF